MEILRDTVFFALLLSYTAVVKHGSAHIWNSRVSTSTPDRMFSSLKRIKTYLRNIMSEKRLNDLAMLAIHINIELSIIDESSIHWPKAKKFTSSEHKWYDIHIYYDLVTSKKVPMVQRLGDRRDEPSTARFGRVPCSCQDFTCGCCTRFNVRLFDYDKKGCMNFTYDPLDFAVKGNMFMDDESLYEYKISAKNPPPACMQVPVPYLPSMDVCLKMFDIYTPGRNLHACVNFLTRIEHAEVLVLEFDCFVIGSDGVNMQKYNATSSTAASAAADTMVAASTTTTESDWTVPDLDFTVVESNGTSPTTADKTVQQARPTQ